MIALTGADGGSVETGAERILDIRILMLQAFGEQR
jgi:hypothetical protein